MTQIIGVGGEPATGKTTLFRAVLNRLGPQTEFEYGLLRGHHYPEDNVFVLGTYDGEQHDGTDALAMNAIVDTKAFLRDTVDHEEYSEATVLFEGDRLFNGAFIEFVRATSGLEGAFLLLSVPSSTVEERHAERGTLETQSDSWLRGRRTKYENVLTDYGPPEDGPLTLTEDGLLYTREHVEPSDTDEIATELLSLT